MTAPPQGDASAPVASGSDLGTERPPTSAYLRVAAACFLIAGAVGVAGTWGALAPAVWRVAREGLRPDALARPVGLEDQLPAKIDSPRYLGIFQILRRLPPGGKVAVDATTYARIPLAERAKNPSCYPAFDWIVLMTGGPVRHELDPPPDATLRLRFLADARAEAEALGLAPDAPARAPLYVVEDLGFYPIPLAVGGRRPDAAPRAEPGPEGGAAQ